MIKATGTILGFACGLLLVAGCATQNPANAPAITQRDSGLKSATPDEQFWVFESGWHTGLVLSRTELGPVLAELLRRSPDAQYFVFGWGNRRYYMADNPSVFMGLAALFPSRSVVLVQSCVNPPSACLSAGARLRVLRVSSGAMVKLDDYLMHSFQKNTHSQFELLAPGPDSNSEFFASRLSYDAFHTCNTWTAGGVRAAGVPVSDERVIFADQLWRQLKPR